MYGRLGNGQIDNRATVLYGVMYLDLNWVFTLAKKINGLTSIQLLIMRLCLVPLAASGLT